MIDKIIQGDSLTILRTLPDNLIDCCVTSPPYFGLRDYQCDGQIGLEKTPSEYVQKLVDVFREVRRILKPSGSLWLNLGDSYAGSGGMGSFVDNKAKKGMSVIKDYNRSGDVEGIKPKNLLGIPWRVAFALQDDGWILRQDIIWHKPNPMPESVKDRCTKSHEYIFLLSKTGKYYYDYKAILEPAAYDGRADTHFKGSEKYKNSGQTFAEQGHERWPNKMQDQTGLHSHEYNPKLIGRTETKMAGTGYDGDGPGLHALHSGYFDNNGKPRATVDDNGIMARNKRSVWTVSTKPYSGAHFATFPPDLIIPMIQAGCPEKGLVFDPFMGSGTVAETARRLNRHYLGIELNPEYIKLIEKRLHQQVLGI